VISAAISCERRNDRPPLHAAGAFVGDEITTRDADGLRPPRSGAGLAGSMLIRARVQTA